MPSKVGPMEDFPYTPTFVRDMLEIWHLIEALKERGCYIIDPVLAATNPSETKDWEKEQSIRSWSVPRSKANSFYHVDEVGSIVCDIEQALDKAISAKQKKRLMLHYLYGYEYGEIAKMEGEESNEEIIKVACWRSINKMAEFLESPAAAKDEPTYPLQDDTYKRKYTSYPRYA